MSLDNIIGQSSTNKFARPSLYLVGLSTAGSAGNPMTIEQNEELGGGLLIKTSSLPATSIGTIEIPYRGRRAYIPSTRALPGDISMTILYHTDQDWHGLFTSWMNTFQNEATTELSNTKLDTNVMTIQSKDSKGVVLDTYKLYGCIPTSIGAAELSSENADSLLEFTVNIQYTYHTFTGESSGLGI